MEITVDLPRADVDFIDSLIPSEELASRSDALLAAVRLLRNEIDENGTTFIGDLLSADKM